VRLSPEDPDHRIWADGISLDPAIQEKLMRRFDEEMRRYGVALNDPATPVGRLRLVTNTPEAAQYLGDRARTLLRTPTCRLS